MATQEDYSAEEARKKLEALPEEIKSFLYSSDMFTAVRKVGEKNQLHIDQIGILQSEITAVLLGFTETQDFPNMLSKALSVDAAHANAIAKDVNEMLFTKIRTSMKKADEHVGKIPAPSQPPAISSPLVPIAGDKIDAMSVVMPSATKAPAPAAPTTHAPAPTMQTIPEIGKPAGLPVVPHVDAMLSTPTVSLAPKAAAAATPTPAPATTTPDVKKSDAPAPPPKYQTDPYHEPVD